MRPPDDLPHLLKRLSRFRSRRARLFARQRKATLLADFARLWPGGYVTTPQGDLAFVPTPIDSQAERILFYGWSAPAAALALLPAGGMAIDVGANLGEWTVPLARAAGADGRVLAVEPNPLIANALAATLRINNLAQASVLQAALSDRDGEGVLQVDPAHTGLSRVSDGAAGQHVTLRRLDAVVAEAGLVRVDLLKIDVEGHERAVLAGADAVLRQFRPALIFETAHEAPADRAAIAAQLAALGYEFVAVLHDYGALACTADNYTAAAGPCAGAEARNILALSR